jgi:hypothetical protein
LRRFHAYSDIHALAQKTHACTYYAPTSQPQSPPPPAPDYCPVRLGTQINTYVCVPIPLDLHASLPTCYLLPTYYLLPITCSPTIPCLASPARPFLQPTGYRTCLPRHCSSDLTLSACLIAFRPLTFAPVTVVPVVRLRGSLSGYLTPCLSLVYSILPLSLYLYRQFIRSSIQSHGINYYLGGVLPPVPTASLLRFIIRLFVPDEFRLTIYQYL